MANPTRWLVWYNTSYFNAGYTYLGPFDDKSASLVMILQNVRENEIESKWRLFLDSEKIPCPEKQGFILEYIVGFCKPREKDNIIPIGNSRGFMESIFGFGLYSAIIKGALAAQAIAENYARRCSGLKTRIIIP